MYKISSTVKLAFILTKKKTPKNFRNYAINPHWMFLQYELRIVDTYIANAGSFAPIRYFINSLNESIVLNDGLKDKSRDKMHVYAE